MIYDATNLPLPPVKKMHAFFLNKQTGRISSIVCYHEHELIMAIMNKGPDWSYVTNDAGLTVEVSPLPRKKGL